MYFRDQYVPFATVKWHKITASLLVLSLLALAALVGPAVNVARANAPFGIQAIHAETLPETPIGPGTTLRQFQAETAAGAQRVGVVTIDTTNPLIDVRLAAAGPPIASRATVADQAIRNSGPGQTVIAAVNGDFFDTAGDYAGIPIGTMFIDGELLLNPWGPALGMLADGTAFVGTPHWEARVEVLDAAGTVVATQPVVGVNRRRDNDRLMLYTAAYGPSTATNEWGAEAVLTGLPLPLTAALSATGTVAKLHPGIGLHLDPADTPGVEPNKGNTAIPANAVVLSGHGEAGDWLVNHLLPGRSVRIVFDVDAPWDEAVMAIGGQPVLLSGGQIASTASSGPSASSPAPRTAVGVDAQGRLVMVTVDGRQEGSTGLTLPQFAALLKDLGLRDALNLDGGGSTTLYGRLPGHLNAAVINRPSDGVSRRVANSLQVVSRAPAGSQVARLWLEATEQRVLPGARVSLTPRAQDEYHGPIDLSRQPVHTMVLSGEGSGTLTDDGTLLALAPGDVHIAAHYGGLAAEARVKVLSVDELGEVRFKPSPAVTAWRWGQTVQLGVEVFDQEGQPLAVNAAALVWEADPELGSIDEAGRLTLADDFPAGQLRVGLRIPTGDGDEHVLPLASWTLAISPDGGAETVFPDTISHWARRDISALTRRQVVRGYPDGLFRPDGSVTRAEMVQMLVGALTSYGALSPAAGDDPVWFADIDELPDWALPAIGVAQATGLVGGFEDGTFRATETVTREQAVLMLIRAAGLAGVDMSPLATEEADDIDRDDETDDDDWADAESADPFDFADLDDIGDWALDAVWLAHQAGLVRGFEDGTFRPKEGLTRSQAAALLVRLLGW